VIHKFILFDNLRVFVLMWERNLIVLNWVFLIVMSLLVTFERNWAYSMENLIEPCKSGAYLEIESLYDYCQVPGKCGLKYEGEGNIVIIKGFIDYCNIVDKTNFPNLPYQKFLITNSNRTKSLEVWVTSEKSDLIFVKIFRQKTSNPNAAVFVRGVLAGFDMPIMGACHRGLKLEVSDEDNLRFDP
jgi:hypothetical protein